MHEQGEESAGESQRASMWDQSDWFLAKNRRIVQFVLVSYIPFLPDVKLKGAWTKSLKNGETKVVSRGVGC